MWDQLPPQLIMGRLDSYLSKHDPEVLGGHDHQSVIVDELQIVTRQRAQPSTRRSHLERRGLVFRLRLLERGDPEAARGQLNS
jgi:hypothetical protein